MAYGNSFKDESDDDAAHPAQLIIDALGGDPEHAQLQCEHLQSWFEEYALKLRRLPHIFKQPGQVTETKLSK